MRFVVVAVRFATVGLLAATMEHAHPLSVLFQQKEEEDANAGPQLPQQTSDVLAAAPSLPEPPAARKTVAGNRWRLALVKLHTELGRFASDVVLDVETKGMLDQAIKAVRPLAVLPPLLKAAVVKAFHPVKVTAGETVANLGDPGDKVYLVQRPTEEGVGEG